MDITQTGVAIIEGDDEVKLVELEEIYGFTGILQYLEDSLNREKVFAKGQEDNDAAMTFMKLENKVRRLILEFQKVEVK